MGRPRKSEAPSSTPGIEGAADIAKNLVDVYNSEGGGHTAYLQGDHSKNTCGVEIPTLAFQWLVGGSNIIPAQRYLVFSGLAKSFKSTLVTEIANWYLLQGGVHVMIDNESKTSPDMLSAMTWSNPKLAAAADSCRIYKETKSIDEWQRRVSKAIEHARSIADRPKGSRVPFFISIDSVTGKTSEEAQEKMAENEGVAASRDFPIDALKISKWISGTDLIGTTVNMAMVQHMLIDISAPPGYAGPKYREKGASAIGFAASIHLRVIKCGAVRMATHPHAKQVGPPIEGYTLKLDVERTCTGPGDRILFVDMLWQYVDQEDGTTKQVMWFDWAGALGRVLWEMKYSDKRKLYAAEKERIDKFLYFVQGKANTIKCEALGLDGVTYSEFGAAIEANPEIRAKVSTLLNISQFSTLQEGDMELGDLSKKDE